MREVGNGVVLSEEEKRRRRQRSVALALVLGALVLLFYAITIVKQGAFHALSS
jgi:hypothetical protein